jgi:hydroxymethylpyrimidine pyrophosphatase-like HAD family hydrolase
MYISTQRRLVSDIDGTLLDEAEATIGLSTLRIIIETSAPPVRLVYATRRSLASTQALIDDGILPKPTAIAPSLVEQ